jgi:hypothetical protein
MVTWRDGAITNPKPATPDAVRRAKRELRVRFPADYLAVAAMHQGAAQTGQLQAAGWVRRGDRVPAALRGRLVQQHRRAHLPVAGRAAEGCDPLRRGAWRQRAMLQLPQGPRRPDRRVLERGHRPRAHDVQLHRPADQAARAASGRYPASFRARSTRLTFSLPAAASASAVSSAARASCGRLCRLLMKKRSRAARSGTAG